jgi:hypothetical protein
MILPLFAQIDEAKQKEEILEFQKEMNLQFIDPEDTPLEKSDWKDFTELDFFPIDLEFAFEAEFVRTPNEPPFMMKRTKDEVKYQKYGEVYFNYKRKEYKLNVYQNLKHFESGEYLDHLFLPFTDLTNDETTYGGGRYIDLTIPEGKTIILDFNQAYNPYCAYNKKYSCPIPPRENDLNIAVKAGVKAFMKH